MNDMSQQPSEYDYRLAVLDKMIKMRDILEPAFKHSHEGHTFKDAFDIVATGRAMFFWNEDSCAVLEWRTYPAGLVVHVLWAGGTQAGLYALYDTVQGLAKARGAVAMTTLGRKGFERRLPKEGWKVAGVWFVKKFEKETS
jgi:hypothetical protein